MSDRVKQYRVIDVTCIWEEDPKRCRQQGYKTIRLWPDASWGPFCYLHARMTVARLERDGYERKRD